MDVFSINSSNDNGASIPYSFTISFLTAGTTKTALLDSWEFFFADAQNFELATILFEALTFPFAVPSVITATFVDLSDPTTFAIPKALPTQNTYNRYIRVTFSGISFYRGFAFEGGTIFLQTQERPSK